MYTFKHFHAISLGFIKCLQLRESFYEILQFLLMSFTYCYREDMDTLKFLHITVREATEHLFAI